MPLDPSIALQYRLPQIDNPIVQYGQAMTLRNAMLQGDVAQRSIADDAAMKEAVRSGAGDLGATQKALLKGGFGKQALEFGKGIREQQESSSKLLEHDSKLVKAFGEQAKEELKTIRTQEQWTAFRSLEMQRASSLTTPQFRELAAKQIQLMPEQFNPQWIQSTLAKTEGYATPDYKLAPAGGTTVPWQSNPNAAGFSGAPIPHTQDPNSIASQGTQRRGQDMTQATAERGQNMRYGAEYRDRASRPNAMSERLYRDYASHPQVKEANDLEARMKPLADYMISFKKTGKSINANDSALAKAYLAVTTSLGNRAYVVDSKALSSLPNLSDRLGNSASSFFAGKDLTDQTRTEMFNYIVQRYKALDTARQEHKALTTRRASANNITPAQIFGEEEEE